MSAIDEFNIIEITSLKFYTFEYSITMVNTSHLQSRYAVNGFHTDPAETITRVHSDQILQIMHITLTGQIVLVPFHPTIQANISTWFVLCYQDINQI